MKSHFPTIHHKPHSKCDTTTTQLQHHIIHIPYITCIPPSAATQIPEQTTTSHTSHTFQSSKTKHTLQQHYNTRGSYPQQKASTNFTSIAFHYLLHIGEYTQPRNTKTNTVPIPVHVTQFPKTFHHTQAAPLLQPHTTNAYISKSKFVLPLEPP